MKAVFSSPITPFVLLTLQLLFYMGFASAENPRRRRFYKDAQFSAIQNYSLANGTIQTVSAHDKIECVSVCLEHSKCVSINYKAEGNPSHLCELVNQTIESTNPENKINRPGFIHLGPAFPPVCLNTPCKNGGTCSYEYGGSSRSVVGYECICRQHTSGRHCEHLFESCQDVINKTGNREMEDGFYPLFLDSTPVDVYCQMKDIPGCENGSWTLVMKTDPNKNTFAYNSLYWSNKIPYNLTAGKTDFDNYETKLPSYWTVPFKEICVGFKVGGSINFITIPYEATSLYDVIADGTEREFSVGKAAWKSLIPGSSLQLVYSKEGFNVKMYNTRSRLGIIANDEVKQYNPDSFLGFAQNRIVHSFYHGNLCTYISRNCDNSLVSIPAYGYILVR